MADIKYGSGKIYAIRSKLTDKFYIGSTCKTLETRFNNHNQKFKNYEVGNANMTSFIIIAYSDAYIELIEDFPCGSRKELERREGELIKKYDSLVVNERIAGRTRKEINAAYYIKNEAKKADYRLKNKAKLSAKSTCECGGRYRNDCKARHMKTKIHQTYIASIATTDTKP
jgi:hypothetical protein